MRAINHALTGAFIGLTVGEPLLAIPAAIVSHFVCDAIPHYNADLHSMTAKQWLKSRQFIYLLVADALLCFALVLILAWRQPAEWWLPALCAFLAAAPDFFWLPRFLGASTSKVWRPSGFSKFAQDIQWFQRPIGAVVECAWFAAGLILLSPFIV